MPKRLVLFSVLPLSLSPYASAQSADDILGRIAAVTQQTLNQGAQAEWQRLTPTGLSCLDQSLGRTGASVDLSVTWGVKPSDLGLARFQSNCRGPFGHGCHSDITQSVSYVVDGLALGGKVNLGGRQYKEYRCNPTEYSGLTWCHKQKVEQTARGEVTSSISIMHNQEGAAVYVNRYIAPAFFGQNDIRNEIDRLSAIFGDRAREFRMPRREGFPNAVIAIWGQLELNQIDPTESLTVASGGSLQKGILISFLDDLQRSAKLGVPVYRLAGGAGFLWSASFDQDGRGVLRFLAIDASLIAGASNAPLHVLPPIVQSPNGVEQRNAAPPPSGFTTEVPNAPSSSPGEKDQPIPKESVVQLAEKDLSAPTLESNQAIRDALFAKLKEGTTRYTFDYLTINLPPGTLPGINVSVPVSHIRYNETVFFAFDKYDLEPPAEAAVLEFARTILQDKSYRSILVVGHTDSIGTGEYNYSLSKKRAVTVAMALRAAGIPDQSLGVVPMGQSQPLTTNITAEGRALNRRVEFFISDVPGATKAAIEQIKFNPCYIISQQTTSGTNCSGGSKSIPILPSSGEGRPIALLDLTRSAIPSDPFVFRLPLPVEPLQRPSIDELQQEK